MIPPEPAPKQSDEVPASHVEHGDFLPCAVSAPPTARRSVYRTLISLPQGGEKVLGLDRNRSESKLGRPAPVLPPKR
jgi:hypothetical protein